MGLREAVGHRGGRVSHRVQKERLKPVRAPGVASAGLRTPQSVVGEWEFLPELVGARIG